MKIGFVVSDELIIDDQQFRAYIEDQARSNGWTVGELTGAGRADDVRPAHPTLQRRVGAVARGHMTNGGSPCCSCSGS